MNLIKQAEFFDPASYTKPIHIIGLGAIGSTLAENLVRIGFEKFHIYDFDKVEEKNLANQMFLHDHVDYTKVEAVLDSMLAINPDLDIAEHAEGFQLDKPGPPLTGIVCLCVDNIDLRRDIVKKLQLNQQVDFVLDFRMALTDAQHYAVRWDKPEHIQTLLKTMDFTHEEAAAATPTSACGTTLSVSPTVRCIVALGVANLINGIAYPERFKNMIWFSPFDELDERSTW